jgi:hypothetical protein
MKKLIVSLSLLLVVASTFAQSDKYQKAMQQNITLLDSAKTGADLQAASASFERVADAEKTQWLPYYYAAIAHIWRGFAAPKDQMDQIATQAENLLAKAEAIEPKSAEIFIAKNMAATIHMLIDPQTRWQTYGAQAAQALAAAKKLDENNPRVYFLEGQSAFGTPVQFGGGKDKAKPLFEKSVALFETYKPASNLYPTWGKQQAKDMLAQCN